MYIPTMLVDFHLTGRVISQQFVHRFHWLVIIQSRLAAGRASD